jgi:hypothetical protein
MRKMMKATVVEGIDLVTVELTPSDLARLSNRQCETLAERAEQLGFRQLANVLSAHIKQMREPIERPRILMGSAGPFKYDCGSGRRNIRKPIRGG